LTLTEKLYTYSYVYTNRDFECRVKLMFTLLNSVHGYLISFYKMIMGERVGGGGNHRRVEVHDISTNCIVNYNNSSVY